MCDGVRAFLDTDIALLGQVNDNLIGNNGKQLRPVLALLMARACSAEAGTCPDGKSSADTIKFAIASELLHNATLLHDDVADESDQRRGKPTLRKLMGPSVSVLVGDFWLVRALQAILSAENGSDKAIDWFAGTLSDLAEGEMLQLQKATSSDTTFEDYLEIIFRKTASLFVVACRTAAMSVGADEALEQAASDYGKYLGYAFQMRDDIFDYMQTGQLGKPVGVDILEQKITLPLLGAFANVTPEVERNVRKSIASITEDGRDEIVDFVRKNGGLNYAQTVLDEYVMKAVDALAPLPDSKPKEILCNLAGYVAIRNV